MVECTYYNYYICKIQSTIVHTSRLYVLAGGNKYDSHWASRQEDGTQYYVAKSINRTSRTFQNYNRWIIFY